MMSEKNNTEKYCGTIVGTRAYDGTLKLSDCPKDIISIKDGVAVKVGFSLNYCESFTLLSYEKESRQVFIKLKEISKEEEALALKEKGIFVAEKHINYKEDKYFIDDVLGCKVFNKQRELLGEITDVLILPANDVWEISSDKKKILLPVIDKTIISVDLRKKKIIVELLEGLMDL